MRDDQTPSSERPAPRSPLRAPSRHRGLVREPWVRTGLVFVSAFLLWLVMDATVLQHNATVISPLGARRTAALDVLDPLSILSRWTLLDLPVAGANEALGRTADGGFVVPTVPTSTTTTTPRGGTTTTRPVRIVATHAHPLRILLVGDSIGEDLDAQMLNDFNPATTRVFTDDQIYYRPHPARLLPVGPRARVRHVPLQAPGRDRHDGRQRRAGVRGSAHPVRDPRLEGALPTQRRAVLHDRPAERREDVLGLGPRSSRRRA